MKLADLPIRRKLIMITLMATGLALLLTTISVLVVHVRDFRKQLVSEASGITAIMAHNLAPAIIFEDSKAAQQILSSLSADTRIMVAEVHSSRRNILFASYRRADQPTGFTSDYLQAELAMHDGMCNKSVFHLTHFDLCKTIMVDNERIGVFVARFGLKAFYAQLGITVLLVICFAGVSLLFAYLLLGRLAAIISTPIQNLTNLTQHVSANQDYSVRATRLASDEIGILTDGFNNMLEEIRRRDAALRGHKDELEVLVAERTAELTAAMEDLKLSRDAAEKSSRAKSDFLSQMSHELRTPLNSILGFGQLLQINLADNKHKEYIEHILSAGTHLLGLIDEILDLAKIEAGKIDFTLEQVALAEVVRECVHLLEPIADQRGIIIQDSLDDACHVCVEADYLRLKQIILNLLSNAVKYNKAGGKVEISCDWPAQERIRLFVIDSGPGLSPAQIKKLFQPFERVGAEKSAVQGTGIGLVISRRLIEMMRGKIGVESSPGIGSRFWIELNISSGR